MQKHYIDIFDDGLYENDPMLERSTSHEATQLIRIQALWAILFDGQVVVPEQWAISSPAFFDLAAEVGGAFNAYLQSLQTTDLERARAVAAPPVMIGLSPSVGDYRSALIGRLTAVDRPIQGLQRLNVAKHEDAASARIAIAKLIGEWQSDRESAYEATQFSAELSSLLGSEKLGMRLAATIRYSSRIRSSVFQMAPYEPAFASELEKLRSFVFSDRPLNRVFENDIALLREVFLHLERDRISLLDPPGVIRLLERYSEAQRNRVLHLGRLNVHNALANISQCTVGSITYDKLANEQLIEFDRILVDETGIKLQPNGGAEPDLGSFEQAFYYGRSSDVHRFFDWNAIWTSVFRLGYSEEWSSKRKEIAAGIAGLPLQKRWDHAVWDDLFDTITSKLATIEMQRDGSDASAFRIGISPKERKRIEGMANALMAASAAAAAASPVPQVLAMSIPIGALGALFFGVSKMSDSRLVTKLALEGRKIARKVSRLF